MSHSVGRRIPTTFAVAAVLAGGLVAGAGNAVADVAVPGGSMEAASLTGSVEGESIAYLVPFITIPFECVGYPQQGAQYWCNVFGQWVPMPWPRPLS